MRNTTEVTMIALIMLLVLCLFTLDVVSRRTRNTTESGTCTTSADCLCRDEDGGRACGVDRVPRRLMPLIPEDFVGARP